MVLSRFLKIVAVAVATALLTYALRSLVIEPQYLADRCTAEPSSALCMARQSIIMGFVFNAYAVLSMVLGVLGIAVRSRKCSWAAVITGVFAALLYRIEFAALGLLFGALGVARPAVIPHDRERNA